MRDQLRYSQIVGSPMFLASATRPDISFAVSKLSRFVSNPGDDHSNALERVMRYLVGTTSYRIHYTRYPRVDIVFQVGSLMQMRLRPRVDMCSHLEVPLFPESIASRPS
jgi:hypothetical protein